MNLSRQTAIELAQNIASQVAPLEHIDWVLCPPYVYLETVAQTIQGSQVAMGAQDMYHEDSGAFTGEISAAMLKDVGCQFVILGHSERRHILGESDETINKKVIAAHAAGLIPMVCVGETLEQRQAGKTQDIIQQQFDGSLAGLDENQMAATVLAYEPVWAIGTGQVASPSQAAQVHADLRKLVQNRYNTDVASVVRIQYGGSVKPENAAELLACGYIDGALVGGASLKTEPFIGIGQVCPNP